MHPCNASYPPPGGTRSQPVLICPHNTYSVRLHMYWALEPPPLHTDTHRNSRVTREPNPSVATRCSALQSRPLQIFRVLFLQLVPNLRVEELDSGSARLIRRRLLLVLYVCGSTTEHVIQVALPTAPLPVHTLPFNLVVEHNDDIISVVARVIIAVLCILVQSPGLPSHNDKSDELEPILLSLRGYSQTTPIMRWWRVVNILLHTFHSIQNMPTGTYLISPDSLSTA